MQFTVQKTSTYDKAFKVIPAFKVVGYNGVGVNFPVESKVTTDEAEAEAWCKAANADEFPAEAGFGSYSDD